MRVDNKHLIVCPGHSEHKHFIKSCHCNADTKIIGKYNDKENKWVLFDGENVNNYDYDEHCKICKCIIGIRKKAS